MHVPRNLPMLVHKIVVTCRARLTTTQVTTVAVTACKDLFVTQTTTLCTTTNNPKATKLPFSRRYDCFATTHHSTLGTLTARESKSSLHHMLVCCNHHRAVSREHRTSLMAAVAVASGVATVTWNCRKVLVSTSMRTSTGICSRNHSG